jgi:hypothetical protein
MPNSLWLQRLWTLQESALANKATIHYGSLTCDWDGFCGLVLNRRDLSKDVILDCTFVPKTLETYRLRMLTRKVCKNGGLVASDNEILWNELHLLRHLEATDPKDKAFGFYGILKVLNIDLPLPDYSKDVAEIYSHTLLAIWTSLRKLNFRHYYNPKNNPYDLPTWVTDWSQVHMMQYDRQHLNTLMVDRPAPAKATGNSVWDAQPLALGDNGLLVEGFVIDRVTKLGKTFLIEDDFLDTHAELLKTEDTTSIFKSWSQLGSNADLVEVMFRGTMGGNIEGREFNVEIFQKWIDDPERNKKVLLVGNTFRTSVSDTMPAWRDQRVVKTGLERLAMVGSRTKVDDVIVLIAGCDLPLVLRPDGNHWNYVGPCYYPGAMEGELWPQKRDQMIKMILV